MNSRIRAEEIVFNAQKRAQNNHFLPQNQNRPSLNEKMSAEIINKHARLNPHSGSIDMNRIIFDHHLKPQKSVRPMFNKNKHPRVKLEQEISMIREQYIPQINEAIGRAKWHRNKAEELGIILEFPAEFFRLQQKDIEKSKRTGVY